MTEDQERLLNTASDLSFHLYEEADRALKSWAAVQPTARCNTFIVQSGAAQQFRNLGLSEAYHHMVEASLRDTIMTLCRMTDSPKQSILSTFQIAELLKNQELQTAVDGEWRWEASAGAERRRVSRHLRFLKKRVPEFNTQVKIETWKEAEGVFVKPITMTKCRAELKRFRDAIIVHAADKSKLGGLHIDRIGIIIKTCALVSRSAMIVFRGTVVDPAADFRRYVRAHRDLRRGLSIEF